MELLFDAHGNEEQFQAFELWNDKKTEQIVYGGAKGGGKSFLGVSIIFSMAFMYPGTHYFISRKQLNDLRKHTIPSIHEVLNIWKLSSEIKYNGQDNYFDLSNGSRVYLISAKYLPSDPDYKRFGSMQMTQGWIEEAGEFEAIARDNLFASVGRWKNEEYGLLGKLLMTCNPAKNFLYQEFYIPHRDGKLPKEKAYIFADIYKNKMVPDSYKRKLERTLKGNMRRRLLLGKWEFDDNPDAICDYEAIQNIFENDQVKPTGKKYVTADVARFGSDKAVILTWDGFVIIECKVFDLSSTTTIQDYILAQRMKYKIPKNNCVADQDGVGGGVVDSLRIKGFANNGKPTKAPRGGFFENYRNLQVQCMYELVELINANGIYWQSYLSDDDKMKISEELEYIVSDNKDLKKLDIKNKDWVKKQIGRSPDYRDALMMRMYFELKPKPTMLSANTFNNF